MAGSNSRSFRSRTEARLLLLALAIWAFPGTRPASAQTYSVLHGFEFPPASPYAALVKGSDGNFYGTTSWGGTSNHGTLFRITPAGALTVLHAFTGSDGQNPYASLVQGNDGYFYGTAFRGGPKTAGVVFRLIVVTAKVSGGGAACAGGSVPVQEALTGAPPWSLTWSDGAMQSNVLSSPAVRIVSPSVATVDTVTTVSDANGPGASFGSATVNVNPVPVLPFVTAPAPPPTGTPPSSRP